MPPRSFGRTLASEGVAMNYTSSDGRYHVEVAEDGAVKVRHGDWLSKYSSAICDNAWNVHVFASTDRSGQLVPVAMAHPRKLTPDIPRIQAACHGGVGGAFD